MAESFEIKPRVLYIDDLQTNLVLLKATFEKDYNVIITDSGTKALEILKNQDIQVLVTDQRMPGVTGTELLWIGFDVTKTLIVEINVLARRAAEEVINNCLGCVGLLIQYKNYLQRKVKLQVE